MKDRDRRLRLLLFKLVYDGYLHMTPQRCHMHYRMFDS
jgi:hypothetical protein